MKLKFHHKEEEAKNIFNFYFERPEDFSYLPGQYLYITLPDLKNDYRGPTRHFTISSAPDDELIRITTLIRDKSNFKQLLVQVDKGVFIEAEGPTGTFILDEEEKEDHLLITGGIGITPFISIIEHNIRNNLDSSLVLLYSVANKKSAAFLDRLKLLEEKSDNFHLIMTYTQHKPKNSSSLVGRINKKKISSVQNKFPSIKKYWLCGPPKMVVDIEKLLKDMNISSSNIISEKFTGY